MSDAVPSRPPLSPAEGWNPPSRDFFGGPPPVDMTSPANVPPVQSEHEFLYGDVPPEVVFTAGGAIAAPSQAHRYATFRPLLERIGPGAADQIQREVNSLVAAGQIQRVNSLAALDATEQLEDFDEAIQRLNEIADGDGSLAEADDVLLGLVPVAVRDAYLRARAER